MGEKLKFIAAAAAAAIAIAALSILAAIWYSRGADGLLAYMPEPSGDAPYVLLETKEGAYPAALSSLLTEGLYAHLKSDMPRGAVLSAAAAANDAAVLIEENGSTAMLGPISTQSLGADEALSQCITEDEAAVGWLYADLPKIGRTIAEMTKVSSFLDEEKNQDFYNGADDYKPFPWSGAQPEPEPFQPEFSLNPFDQETADSFAKALGRLERVMIV